MPYDRRTAVVPAVDTVAPAVQSPVDPVAFSVQALGTLFVSGRLGTIGATVETVIDTIAAIVETLLDSVATVVDPVCDAVGHVVRPAGATQEQQRRGGENSFSYVHDVSPLHP